MTMNILLVDDNPACVARVRQSLDFLPGVQVVGHAQTAGDPLGAAAGLAARQAQANERAG